MNDLRFLPKGSFKSLIDGLMSTRAVWGTVIKDGFPAFARITRFTDLVLSQTPTHLSAKEFLFPAREALLRFDRVKNTHEAVVEATEQVIIGLHPCDIHAITLMDRVFSSGAPDANYLAKRAKTIIIGTDCLPDEYCFCKSLGTGTIDKGFDLFMHAAEGGHLVRAGSKAGEDILKKYARPEKPSSADIKRLEKRAKQRDGMFKAHIDAPPHTLPEIYSKSADSPVWDRIGSICTGCGSCNNVCPTCYCFDVKDEMSTDLKTGERVRTWDGCTLEDFAKVAGPHNFRKTRGERLRHRFNRKFNYLTDRFGALFCVGCGRCSRTCLVKINISEVTNELIGESGKKRA